MLPRYLSLVAIWSGSFLFIKVGLEVLAPLQVVLGRMALGTAVLLLVALVGRVPLPREPRLWGHLAVVATLLNTVPFVLFGYAEQRIPSAIASICNATTPLFTLVIALFALPDERPTRQRTLGLVVGFAGVSLMLGLWNSGARPDPIGVALGLFATLLYAVGGVYMRRYLSATRYSGLALSTVQLLIGTAQLAVVTPLVTRMPESLPLHVIAAIATLGALGTGLAYVLQYDLIRIAGATITSTVTYCLPVVSIALGVVVLGEQLAWTAPAGAAIIIAGALISRHRSRTALLPRAMVSAPVASAVPATAAPIWVKGLG